MEAGVAGLLLAAGGGSRYGGPKALIPFEGELLVERGARMLDDGGCAPVVVVLGAGSDEVRDRADLAGAEAVDNPDWASGMASSVRAGLDALDGRAEAVVIALADQPLVGAEAVRRLIGAWRDGARAAVATYDGAPRNPVLLDRSLWTAALAAAHGDVGVRALLRPHPELVAHIACDDTGSPADIDTPDDLDTITTTATTH